MHLGLEVKGLNVIKGLSVIIWEGDGFPPIVLPKAHFVSSQPNENKMLMYIYT